MEELIKISKSPMGKDVVSAKELHSFLKIETEAILWCKRMFEYGFEENTDYAVIKSENPINKQVTTSDFVLTLDCAKEISMVQRSEKGKEARLYFIKCEKELRVQQPQVPKVFTQRELLQLNIELLDRAELAEAKIEADAPKLKAYDVVISADGLHSMAQIAQIISGKTKDHIIGRNNLTKTLRGWGWLKKDEKEVEPMQGKVNEGIFEVKVNGFGTNTTKVTKKGLDKICKRYLKELEENEKKMEESIKKSQN